MKKLVSLLLALALLLTAAVCVAEGSEATAIGSPDNPVVVRYLCKDVDPSDPTCRPTSSRSAKRWPRWAST